MSQGSSSGCNLSREQQFLVSVCSAAVKKSPTNPTPPKGIDWQMFVALARDHFVVPLVHSRIRLGMPEVPDSVQSYLRDECDRAALRNLQIAARLVAIAEAFSAADISVVPLKGICLAARYYSDVGLRSTNDIDLLIDPQDFQQALHVLRELGYRRVSNETRLEVPESFEEDHYLFYHSFHIASNGTLVELHIRLHPNPKLLPIGADEIEATEEVQRIGNMALPVMSDALQFTYLATHGARHDWRRLQWVCDIGTMLRRATEEETIQWLAFARKLHLRNPAVQALVIANRLLGVPLPSEARRCLPKFVAYPLYGQACAESDLSNRTGHARFGDRTRTPHWSAALQSLYD